MKVARDSNGELVYAYKGIDLDMSEYYACPSCGESVQICQKKNGEYFFRHITQARHDGETEAHQKGINATIRMHTFGNLKMYKIDSSVIMILR